MSGKVFLVGAGPGDPGLLTRKAERLLQHADLVVIDALVSPEIRALIPAGIEIIEAGKRASKHTLTQDAINQLLVDKGREGRRVVRLKGGDPFVFGRGGEEAEQLSAAGVAFEIVPGISSSIAGPAYAGIPVTHRSLATSFTVVTAHESDETSGVDWHALASVRGTLVLLMGLGQIEKIAQKLIGSGKPESTPIAVIAHATTPRQRSVDGTLATIAARVAEAGLTPPALIVVGDVVTMAGVIGWFEQRPLYGRTVVVTRAREQASRFAEMLEEEGARVVQFPTIEIAAPDSWDSLDLLLDALQRTELLIFTSSNGVEAFFERLVGRGLDARALAGRRIAAVGKPTALALRSMGIVADIIPDRYQSSALLPLLSVSLSGMQVGVVRAARGNDQLLDELRRRGATVMLGVAYQTRAAAGNVDALRSMLDSGGVDVVTFTSGSTVENFFDEVGAADLSRVVLASIGPQTSMVLKRLAGRVDIEAATAEIESLRDVIVEKLSGGGS